MLATSLSPAGGKVTVRPRGAGCVDARGALWVKWPWWRKVPGQLNVQTTKVGGDEPALDGIVPRGYGNVGFQPSVVGFPGPGCWEVTAHLGKRSLSFVTLVEKVGDGPRPCNNEGVAQR